MGKDRIYPLFTTDISRASLVYNYRQINADYVSQTQLEIKIISNDYDEAKGIEQVLKNILAQNKGENFKHYKDLTFKATLAGGGSLYQDEIQMFENSLIFIITYK